MKLDSQIEDLKIKFKSLNDQLLNSENLGNKEIIQINKELSKLEPVINIANEIQRLEKEIIGYKDILENEKDEEHLLLVVIAGNAPKAEFTDLAYKRISEFENKSD